MVHGDIVKAIQEAERGTSGEVHVHISRRLWEPNATRRAESLFFRLGLHQTRNRNAVLLYVNTQRRKFAIVGDTGIHQQVGQVFWDQLKTELERLLAGTALERAVCAAVKEIGIVLRRHFPLRDGDENANELSDTVTRD